MERIVIEVGDTTARKWQQASDSTKKHVTEMLEHALAGTEENTGETSKPLTPFDKRLQEIKAFYSRFNIDMSGFKFNRDEANER